MSGPGGIISIVEASATSLSARQMPVDAEPRLAAFREQAARPRASSFFVRRLGELVKAVRWDEAATRRELASVRAELVDALAAPRPTPSALHQIAAWGSPLIVRTIGAVSVILMSSRASGLGLPSGKRILTLSSEKSEKIVAASVSNR